MQSVCYIYLVQQLKASELFKHGQTRCAVGFVRKYSHSIKAFFYLNVTCNQAQLYHRSYVFLEPDRRLISTVYSYYLLLRIESYINKKGLPYS